MTLTARSWWCRPVGRLLICLLVMGAVVAQDGSMPHGHGVWAPGLYNLEHDLVTLATVGAGGPLPAAGPSLDLDAPGTPAPPTTADARLTRPLLHRDSRAPPAR